MEREVMFLGRPTRIACDGQCRQATGLTLGAARRVSNSYTAMFSFPDVATDQGAEEARPGVAAGRPLNRWCVRHCERMRLHPVHADRAAA